VYILRVYPSSLTYPSFGSILALFVVDTLYYGRPISTPLNFILTNFSSVSLFYGRNPWHYYLTQALPILCTTALPFVGHGVYTTLRSRGKATRNIALETMLATIAWFISVYSLAGHKEWRFIHPVLPLLQIFAAKSLVELGSRKPHHNKKSKEAWAIKSLPIRQSHFIFLLLTLPVSIYIVLFYCSAPISVLSYIRALPLIDTEDKPFIDTVGFLMPCHSTPGQAYIHRKVLADVPGRLWSLGCEPPLNVPNVSTYRDQTNIFFSNPKAYLDKYFPATINPSFPPSPFPRSPPGQGALQDWKHEWPKHLIMFGELLRDELGVKKTLEEKGYREVWSGGRGWEGEDERKGGVRVWRWRD